MEPSNIREFTSLTSLTAGIKLYLDEGYKLTSNGKMTGKLVLSVLTSKGIISNDIVTQRFVRRIRIVLDVLKSGGSVIMKVDHNTLELTLLVDFNHKGE